MCLKNGQYNIRICIRNLVTQEVTEQIINVYSNKDTVTLGDDTKENKDNEQTSDSLSNYCRTYTFELLPGVDQDDVSVVI